MSNTLLHVFMRLMITKGSVSITVVAVLRDVSRNIMIDCDVLLSLRVAEYAHVIHSVIVMYCSIFVWVTIV